MSNDTLIAEPGSLLELSERVERGFPLQMLYEWQAIIAPDDRIFLTRIVAAGTLKRRIKQNALLSSIESERLQRAIDAWAAAVDTYKEEALAREFLQKPHSLFDRRAPLSVALCNDPGLEAVKGVLGRLKHGTAA